jgi:two-component sensor histidine kinase
MALVHEKFYQSEALTEIDFAEYIEKLCHYIYQTYGDKTDRIQVEVKGDHIGLDMDTAMPCGLLVNEIVSNAYKYAFPGHVTGKITVSLKRSNGKTTLGINDNGIGLPEGFDFDKSESLGMQLIQALTNQLDGELALNRENGTSFEVSFLYPKNVVEKSVK